jgi:hypothetical protein
MPLAHEVATELRKLADALDKSPEAEIEAPSVSFYHFAHTTGCKEKFLSVARLLPRPIVKGENYSKDGITVSHKNDAIDIYASVPKAVTCELVEPAKPAVYRCDPILSEAEESSLEVL